MSRRSRVRWNANMKRMTYTEVESYREKMTHEEWALMIATNAVGTGSRDGTLHREDVLSDILLKLIDAGGMRWDAEQITEFCQSEARKILTKHFWRVEKPEAEFSNEDFIQSVLDTRSHQIAMQELIFIARESAGLVRALPTPHRLALETLIDGGNPVEIAEEQGISVAHAITLIKEARAYVSRIDPA